MDDLYPPFRQRVLAARLIPAGGVVLLGFSGGKDSVTLAMLLQELRRERPFRLVLAYLNHGLRPDATHEEAWVRQFAKKQRLELRVGNRPVARWASENRLNLEHAASLSRYGFFGEVAREFPGARIATAHTRSDLAETFLIKLLRGSGLQGLSALHQRKERHLIRPLLLFSEQEVRAFLERNQIEHYEDPSNEGDAFLRNRLRHRVMPVLKEIEPHCEERIFTAVQLIQDEFEYFQRTAERFLCRHLIAGTVLPVAPLKRQRIALIRHLLREYIRRQKGNLLGLSFAHVEELRAKLGTTSALAIPGLTLATSPHFLYPQPLRLPPWSVTAHGPGRIPLALGSLAIEVTLHERFEKPAGSTTLITPARLLPFPFTVRSVCRGDEYRKINVPHHQQVVEMIRAAGFPVALRPLAPVVVAGDGHIAWAYGSPLAADFAVAPGDPGPFVRVSLAGLPTGFQRPPSTR